MIEIAEGRGWYAHFLLLYGLYRKQDSLLRFLYVWEEYTTIAKKVKEAAPILDELTLITEIEYGLDGERIGKELV